MPSIRIPSTEHLIRLFIEQGVNLLDDQREELLIIIEQTEQLRIRMLRLIAEAQSRVGNRKRLQGS